MPFLLPDLSVRRREPELMDDPGLDEGLHRAALRSLRTVNVLSGTAGRVWREVASLERPQGRPLRVLDLACGGGDVAVALARRARRAGLAVEVHGCDQSPLALRSAAQAAEAAGVEVTFFGADVVAGSVPRDYDLLCCSLFLHHLARADAVALLGAMARAAPALLVQDLRRTRTGYLLALMTLNTLARSAVARADGLRSVAAAFTLGEAAALAREAGLEGCRLRRCWPQRWALSWRRA